MKLIKLIVPALVTFLFAACSQERNNTDGVPILVFPNMNTRATDTNFESGDEIGISISISSKYDFKENVSLTHNGTHFVSPDVQWYESSSRGDFEAYYPFQDVLPQIFTISSDQTGDGYDSSDFMMSRAPNVEPNPVGVSMDFTHVMAQIIVRVISESNLDISKVTVGGTQLEGAVNFDQMTVSARMGAEVRSIEAQKIDATNFRTIIVPQSATLKVTIENDRGQSVTRDFEKKTFASGSSYVAKITIDDEFDITDTEIISNGDINLWNKGDDLNPKN